MASERVEYGLTGNPERDGYLTIEQQRELEYIQDRATTSLLDALANKTDELFPMAAMATGFGKGRIAHKVIAEIKRQNPKAKILFISGTKQTLVNQTRESLESHQRRDLENLNDDLYIDAEDDDELIPETLAVDNETLSEKTLLYNVGDYGTDADVENTTMQKVQSEYKRGKLEPSKYDLVIVDEVHNIGTPARKASLAGFSSVIGFTATAYRHTGSMKSPKEYGFKIVESLPLPDAQEMGFLPPLVGMQLDTTSLVEEIPTTYTGKINYTALEKILKESPKLRPYIAERLSHILRTENGIYKTVIAVNYVWEAKEIALLMKGYGFRVGIAVNQQATKEHHTDQIPAIDTIRRYKLPASDPDAIDILISPYVASEGFDAPMTEVVVWASPTDSPVRYTQYTGRLARRAPGKRYGVIVDCLYQTQQYNYSYNMAMWMKGNVRQLDNGLLYLGPERNIEELGQLVNQTHFATENRRQIPKEMSDLINETLLSIQPNETIINPKYLTKTFVGDYYKLKLFSDQCLETLRQQYLNEIHTRLNGSARSTTLTEQGLIIFTELMIESGAKLKIPIQPNETIINPEYLKNTFIDGARLSRLAEEAIQIITEYYPNLYPTRINSGHEVSVFTDPNKFIEVMKDLGARLQEGLLPLQLRETALNPAYLKDTFINNIATSRKLALVALEIIDEYYPDLYPTRINSGHEVSVFTDPNKFIEVMQDLGSTLKTLLPIQPGETSFSSDYLDNTFVNGRTYSDQAKEALEIIDEYYPDLYPLRRNYSHEINVFTDPNKFIEVMQDLGAKLQISLPIQPRETSINPKYLNATFINGGKNSDLAKEALEIIDEYYPDLYPIRKNGSMETRVFTDPNKFIEVMQDLGLKPQEGFLPVQPEETIINDAYLISTFISGNKYGKLVKEALEIISEYYPNLYPIRKNSSQRPHVFTDSNKFIEVMQDLGAKLRSPNPESVS